MELTRQLRRDRRTRDTRIIVLTGQPGAAFERQAYEAGCDRFIVKPCPPAALAFEMRSVLAGAVNRCEVTGEQ